MKSKWALLVAGMAMSVPAQAHVKWFSMMANCASAPVTTLDVISSPLFIGLTIAACAVMFAVAAADSWMSNGRNFAVRSAAWLDRESAALVAPLLRIGVAVYFVAIVVYFRESPIVLTLELKTDAAWVPFAQLAIAAAVLSRRGAALAALGIVALFAYSISRYGVFHMLDYPFFLGVAAFLGLDALYGRDRQLQGLGILRLTVGLSLLWCSVEKWLYPAWTQELLQSDLSVLLETGFSPTLIVMGAGFVEFCLAFLLIFGRVASQIAAAVLLSVMVSAIPVVGMLDLVGHLPILVVLTILAVTRNPIGSVAGAERKRWNDFDPALSFMVSVPGFIAAYYLSHELVYGSLQKVNWTEGLVAGVLLAILMARIVGTAPHAFARVVRLNAGNA